MQTTRRELLSLVLIGLCSLAAVRAGAQVEGADGGSGGVITQRRAEGIERTQSPSGVLGRPITLTLLHATMKEALRAVARQADVRLIYNDSDLPVDRLVTVTISDATVEQALALVLRGTELRARPTEGGIAVEPQASRARSERRALQGSLSGLVTDATDGKPVAGVDVRLEEVSLSASTGSDGTYRFPAVPAGTYTLTARRVGYQRVTRTATITDGEERKEDIAMTPAPTILEQVVTTGTVIPTEVKALPTPISVVTADQIEQQHAFTMMAIIRQAVPTAVAHDAPNIPANTSISVRGASSLTGTGDMKIFIDGVEASSSGNVAVDPSSIDRIEVIRGPQAATLYGADAAGGVIQIFTKRGDSSLARPQVNVRAALGVTQTPYEGLDGAMRQQYSGSVRGGMPGTTYRLGGSYTHLADYAPDNGPTRQSASGIYGGMNFSRGIFSLDLSGRYYRNTIPAVLNPEVYAMGYVPLSRPQYRRGDFTNQTYGVGMTLSPTSWLTSNLKLGIDRLGLDNTQTQPHLTTPADTLLAFQSFDSRKLSAGYNMTASGRLGGSVAGSLTLGIDHYVKVVKELLASGAVNTSGTIATVPPGGLNFSNNAITNTGYFAQAQISVRDALYLTAGVRSEDNSTFGKDYGVATLPRVGASYVHPVGAMTLKLRASYGESLRTPGPSNAAAKVTAGAIQLANSELAPEKQLGWDGGVDLVFGSTGSLSVSAFDQTAIDLIAFLQVASSPLPTYQYRNIGRVSNKGIGVEGTFKPAPWLEIRGQYGYVRSRVKEVGAAGGQVQAGDAPIGVPAHTAGAALTFTRHEGTTLNAGVTYLGSFRNTDVLGELRCLATFSAPECPESFLSTFSFRDFIMSYPGFAKLNASIAQRLRSNVEVFLSVENLTNNKAFEFDNSVPVVGRTTMLGFEVTY
jgi:outer membrane receptor protein involved in Fe transport